MKHRYTFRILVNEGQEHREIATYDRDELPWVPSIGSLFRLCDPGPAWEEVVGHVADIVTAFYGTRTTIEIYLNPPKRDARFECALSDMKQGQRFKMLNYDSLYMRVATNDPEVKITLQGALDVYTNAFDVDELHLPVVDLATGRLFWMARQKPVSPVPL